MQTWGPLLYSLPGLYVKTTPTHFVLGDADNPPLLCRAVKATIKYQE